MQLIKVGGNDLDKPDFLLDLAENVRRLQEESGQPTIIVHGGGKAIADLQLRLGLEPRKIDGLRITDEPSLNVAQMVLSGHSNKLIVNALLSAGVDAIGLSGVDAHLLTAQKKEMGSIDLGLVGEIISVRTRLLRNFLNLGLTPVISPISASVDNTVYNINADEAASAIAKAMGAHILHFVSNVPGVLQDGVVLPALTIAQTEGLISRGVITDGMVPKVRAALTAVTQGVEQARIVNLSALSGNGGTVFRA